MKKDLELGNTNEKILESLRQYIETHNSKNDAENQIDVSTLLSECATSIDGGYDATKIIAFAKELITSAGFTNNQTVLNHTEPNEASIIITLPFNSSLTYGVLHFYQTEQGIDFSFVENAIEF